MSLALYPSRVRSSDLLDVIWTAILKVLPSGTVILFGVHENTVLSIVMLDDANSVVRVPVVQRNADL
jgi:hypothetical protein